ncbi:hypothetical protein VOLCADRAFT_100138 [Volvox carteri f. nagariensis]|uniref:Protein kinase domain-containing protein n=1 Tax=Volvox carteri f. nagariensis TaxID=3068 RepID=D8UJI3_VOLCA|nr:uncharacterized protein VOLCADRAFT_100138 [Volvox carteri f. nagariensis]EFJ40128.1 hypothetical protein VOLCADRAFT_100138 [Volvox carteri f. nagariensis]|eukprot:XP_002958824.1 hypothetical protein VOLCADRAFT_100138 [Volvox carteri f. nagariensis]
MNIAQALSYLHPTILHRDLKPANVLIAQPDSDKPIAKLADFGLSRLRDTVLMTQNPEVGTACLLSRTARRCTDGSHALFPYTSVHIRTLGLHGSELHFRPDRCISIVQAPYMAPEIFDLRNNIFTDRMRCGRHRQQRKTLQLPEVDPLAVPALQYGDVRRTPRLLETYKMCDVSSSSSSSSSS